MEQAMSFFKWFTAQGSDRVSQPVLFGNESTLSIPISGNRIVVAATAVAGCLLLVSFTSDVGILLSGAEHAVFSKLSKAFSVDRESNVSAFFSTLLLMTASALLAGISILRRTQPNREHRYWLALAAGFLFMAFDEIAEVHERLIEPIRNMLGGGDLGVLYYAWVIPGGVVVLLCGGIFFRFWWNLPPRVRTMIFIAAGLYLGGAVGVELLGGKHAEMFGTDNLKYVSLTTIEETLEITGSILFIKALFDHLSEVSRGRLILRLTNSQTDNGDRMMTDPASYAFDNRTAFAREDVVKYYLNANELLPAERVLLQRIGPRLTNARILDLGVGGGRTTPALLELSRDYTGVDYVPEFVEAMRERFPDVRFICADARKLEGLDDGSYDFVLFSYNGIDCVPHDGRLEIFSSVYRVLKPGGIFMFSSHNRDYEFFNKLPWQRKIVFSRSYLTFLIHCLYHLPKHYRNKRHETLTDDYAIINDGDHRFSLLLYYISIGKQTEQLEATGFSDVEAFDNEGLSVLSDTGSHWIHYLARKP